MSSQRLFQVLLFIVFAATSGAFWLWRTTGEPPPTWLNRAIFVLVTAATAVFLVSDTLRPRLMLRFLASLFALIAAIAIVSDFSHAAATGFKATSMMSHWNDFAPSLLASSKNALSRTPLSFLWDPVLTTLFGYPTFLIFAGLALLTGLASRPRREVRIFVN